MDKLKNAIKSLVLGFYNLAHPQSESSDDEDDSNVE
jgi:hypothetical protein